MRSFLIAIILFAAVSTAAQAGDRWGNYNMFWGYSYVSADVNLPDRVSYHGVGGNLQRYVTVGGLSVVGDFSIHFTNNSTVLYALGGLRQDLYHETAIVFVEGLAGLSYLDPMDSDSQTAPAIGGGGGVDWRVWDRIYLRIPQVDLLYGRHAGNGYYDVRLQLGASFPF